MKKTTICIISYCFVILGLTFSINEDYVVAILAFLLSLPLLYLVMPEKKQPFLNLKETLVLLSQVLISLCFNKANLLVPLLFLSIYHLYLFKVIRSLRKKSAHYLIKLGMITGIVLVVGILAINLTVCILLQLTRTIALDYLVIPGVQLIPFIVSVFDKKPSSIPYNISVQN